MNQRPSAESLATGSTWREIEQLVEEVSGLARSDVPPREFHAALLDRAVRALAAVGGAIWIFRDDGTLQLEHHINAEAILGLSVDSQLHGRLLERTARAAGTWVMPPCSNVAEDPAAGNPAPLLLLLCPVRAGEQVVTILEILQRPGASPETQEGYVRLLDAFASLAADFHRFHQTRQLQGQQADWDRTERLVHDFHRDVDLDATAYVVANEGRQFIGCDRLSVLMGRGRSCRLRSVSGVDTIDRRSSWVRSAEELAEAVLGTGEPLWTGGAMAELAPRLETALQSFVDQSHSRLVAVLPLCVDSPDDRGEQPGHFGALLLERFTVPADEQADRRRAAVVARHGASALRNAARFQDLPFASLLRPFRRNRWTARERSWPWSLIAMVAFLAIATVLMFVRVGFRVEARGELQPQVRRDVFAPNDGIVQRVAATHAQRVAAGEVLVELRRSELEFESARLLGELQTARKQLDTTHAARLQAERSRAPSREEYEQYTAKEEELKKLLESLEAQQAVLREQRAQLQVKSPVQGQVLTWDVAQSLDARPVQRGQILMTIIDPRGPWILELRVADDQIGYVLAAQRDSTPELEVSFVLATDPNKTHRGSIERVAMAAETDEKDASHVRVTVRTNFQNETSLRPGATVLAQIHCGRRSLGFVWFRGLIEAVRKRLWL